MYSYNIILIIFFIYIDVHKILSLISIPFSFKNINYITNYNSRNFFYDYFKKEIILQFNIGIPPQKIKALVDQNSECFKLIQDKYNDYFNDSRYYPNISSSFNKEKSVVIFHPYFEISNENFNFINVKDNYTLKFLIDNYTKPKNISFLAVCGLNIPIYYSGINCPNLISELKKAGLANKLIWSLVYSNKNEGNFIIGEELSIYDSNKYPNSKYSTQYLTSRYLIVFDYVSIINNNNKNNINKINLNITETYININFGFIIGIKEYKDYIDTLFFNELLQKEICTIDLINYNNTNEKEKKFSNDYYIYSCDDKQFINNKYYSNFPNLIFRSKTLEYNFELNNHDLFEHIFDRYFFLVVFKKNRNINEKEIWYLGDPFYKKYTFTINADAKTIGFYIEKNYNDIDEQNNININNENNNENISIIINKIIYIFFEIIIIICFIFLGYFIGIKIKERRKKRANELKDDNYEYLPENNKNINNVSNNKKKQQFVELNSRLGF